MEVRYTYSNGKLIIHQSNINSAVISDQGLQILVTNCLLGNDIDRRLKFPSCAEREIRVQTRPFVRPHRS